MQNKDDVFKLTTRFLRHAIYKALLIIGDSLDTLEFQQSLNQTITNENFLKMLIHVSQENGMGDILLDVPIALSTVFIFKIDVLKNIYLEYNLERLQNAKVIFLCNKSLLHPSLDPSIYFGPIKNGCLQRQLLTIINITTKINHDVVVQKKPHIENSVDKSVASFSISDHFLNQRYMTNDTLMMRMLADRVINDAHFKEYLFSLVFSTKTSEDAIIAAANAMTVLNTAKISFAGLDLANIKVPNANISGCNLHFTNLSDACLENTNLSDAFLVDTVLNRANLSGANFGEHAGILFSDSIMCLALSKDMRQIVVVDLEGMIALVALNSGMITLKIKAVNDGENVIFVGYDTNNNVIVVDKNGAIGIWFWAQTQKIVGTDDNNFYLINDNNTQYLDVYWQKIKHAINNIIDANQITIEAFAYSSKYCAVAYRIEDVYVTTVFLIDMENNRPAIALSMNADSNKIFANKYQNNSICTLAIIEQKALLCAIYEGGGIVFWNLNTLQMLVPREKDFHHAKISYSPRNNYYALAQNRYRSQQPIIEVIEGNEIEFKTINVLKGHKYGISSIGFIDQENLLITSGNDATVRFWEFAYYQNKNESHSSTLFALDVNIAKNIVATGDFSGKIIIWNLQYGIILKTYNVNRNIHTLKFIENNNTLYLCIGCDGYGLNILNYINDEQYPLSCCPIYDIKHYEDLEMGIGVGYEVVIFKMEERLSLNAALPERIYCFLIDPISRSLFLGSFKGNILHYKLDFSDITFNDSISLAQHLELKNTIKAHNGQVSGIVECEDKLISSGEDGRLIIWRKLDMQRYKYIDLNNNIGSIALHRKKNILLLGVQRNIFIFDTKTWNCIEIIPAHKCEQINRILFCSDDTMISCGDDQTVNVWKLRTITNPQINASVDHQIPKYLKSPIFSQFHANRKQTKISTGLLHWASSQQFWCKGCKFDEANLAPNNRHLLEQRSIIYN